MRNSKIQNCAYCDAEIENGDAPEAGDDAAWRALSEKHGSGCEWIETRAFNQKPQPFSEILRAARTDIAVATGREKKLTQTEMAKILGIAPNYVAMLESGDHQPSATIRNCLAYAVRLAILFHHDPLLVIN